MTADASLALEARVRVRRGEFELNAAVDVAPGEVLAVLGPNGSGKSTLLATLAGLIVPDEGTITVRGRRLTSTAADGTGVIAVPPEHRGVGLLGQNPLLFPHLSVEANVAFGRQAQGRGKKEALWEAAAWLGSVGLADFGRRRPHELSGGQQQRVSIARALAARPDLLLLDEPMDALDVQTAVLIRRLLRQQLTASGTSAIVVTHDVLDVFVLADRVAILHDGRIVDEGPVARVLGQPRNPFIAALAGVNLVRGRATDGGALETHDGRRFQGREPILGSAGAQLSAAFRPAAVALAHEAPSETTQTNHWQARVTALDGSTGGIRLHAGDVSVDVSAAEVAERGIRAGDDIWLSVASADVSVWARDPQVS